MLMTDVIKKIKTDNPQSEGAVETSDQQVQPGVSGLPLFNASNGQIYARLTKLNNTYVVPLKGLQFRNIVREELFRRGATARSYEVQEVIEILEAKAWIKGDTADVYYRVAPIENGIEIDIGDAEHTRIQITKGRVSIITSGSTTLFYRTPIMRELTRPAPIGNLGLLRKYLNLSDIDRTLLIAWISYTLAHPKVSLSKFLILVLIGDMGSGKSALVKNIILPLIDPTILGVQIFPSQPKELSIAQSNTHVLAYDNMRTIGAAMSDILCVACTGGMISSRALYTDSDMNLLRLHGPVILNGISSLLEHSDLAQRCLPLRTRPISESDRLSDAEIVSSFQTQLPQIMKGLFDLISNVFTHLDNVKVLRPERMISFTRWLAAMEIVDSAEPGTYQNAYSDALNQAQLDSLMEHPLADAVIAFMASRSGKTWGGPPSGLLSQLNEMTPKSTQYSQDWPRSAISLSKRLTALKASFLTQGIHVEMTRGKQRKITISCITNDLRYEVTDDDDY